MLIPIGSFFMRNSINSAFGCNILSQLASHTALNLLSLDCPTGQRSHEELPSVDAYVLRGHGMHTVDPMCSAKVSMGHFVHSESPCARNSPIGHGVHMCKGYRNNIDPEAPLPAIISAPSPPPAPPLPVCGCPWMNLSFPPHGDDPIE